MAEKKEHKDTIKITLDYRIMAVIILTALVVFGFSAFYFKYYPEMQKEKTVNSYKKAVYDSVYCQYSCPLESQFIAKLNRTELVPSSLCVESCTEKFRNSNFTEIDQKLLIKDSLFKEMQEKIQDCKTESAQTIVITNETETLTPQINTTFFFECSAKELEIIKDKYAYLK